jgi:hypothetical protein
MMPEEPDPFGISAELPGSFQKARNKPNDVALDILKPYVECRVNRVNGGVLLCWTSHVS